MNNYQKFPSISNLIKLHNEARNNTWFGKTNELKEDNELSNYAIDWAISMANKNKLIHSNMKNISKLGFSTVGENIAYGQETENSVMKTWLWSPGHRRNIMNKSFTHIGCGFAYSNDGTVYWCVCFGGKNLKEGS